jgi:hypothetical protein
MVVLDGADLESTTMQQQHELLDALVCEESSAASRPAITRRPRLQFEFVEVGDVANEDEQRREAFVPLSQGLRRHTCQWASRCVGSRCKEPARPTIQSYMELADQLDRRATCSYSGTGGLMRLNVAISPSSYCTSRSAMLTLSQPSSASRRPWPSRC